MRQWGNAEMRQWGNEAMKSINAPTSILLAALCAIASPAFAQTTLQLDHDWTTQSSAKVADTGAAISTAGYTPAAWYPTTVPATVMGALVANKVYKDPMFGMNLRDVPGTTYPIGNNFSKLPMPDGSPFHVPWWYRTEFTVPYAMRGRRLSLHLDGINYRANIWINGKQIASSTDCAGTYRLFEFDVTDALREVDSTNPMKPRLTNALAIEIFPPEPDDLAWTWVDWNPAPPDKNMGLWRPVSITASGDVTIRHPLVAATVDAAKNTADITVSVELHNLTKARVTGVLSGELVMASNFTRTVTLGPGETRVETFAAGDTPRLHVTKPWLWWPIGLGAQNMSVFTIEFRIGNTRSEQLTTQVGIREITSEINATGGRQFFVNGKPLLIRGGGWAPDMLLRPNTERQDAEFAYVRDMHLNTIRLEGKLEDERFFQLADRYGILVLAGWCCCDQWEQWAKWKPENKTIAAAAEHDQICRLRSHPSVLAWLNGSDNPPPADIEQMYVDILTELQWPNPYVSSATAKKTTVTGASGMKMEGPYDWVPPSYWLVDATHGGAKGFATEISPGAAVPPIESLKKMLPADHLWPIDDAWNYHAGGGQFKDLKTFTAALNARYGEAKTVDDYAMKAQLMTYEGERAMFEGYARNAPQSTGVIQWMLNNAWPSMIWHLYDYYLRPGGGYFGTKKACEPLHVQYSYDDRSIVVVNTTMNAAPGMKVTARVLNLDGTEKFAETKVVDMPASGHATALTIPALTGLSPTYFVDLRLFDAHNHVVSQNLYWLGTKMDEMDLAKSTWYGTPVTSFADFTALSTLPKTTVAASTQRLYAGDAVIAIRPDGTRTVPDRIVGVTLHNTGVAIAFFVRLQITKGEGGEEILPVLWEDNYITLLPGESRTVAATMKPQDLGGATPALVVTGWNIR
jgi:exo-1,4-beta-D-glucosaminidase